MGTLHTDLQTGFQNDSVAIAVDGETVYEKDTVTTSLLEGMADSFEVTIESGTHQVNVQLPDRNMEASHSVDVKQDIYLGISVEEGKIVFRQSENPFGYA